MDPKLWMYVKQKMYMIRHDFHFDDLDLDFAADWHDQLLQSGVNAVDQYFSTVFGAKNDMIVAWIDDIVARMIFNLSHICII